MLRAWSWQGVCKSLRISSFILTFPPSPISSLPPAADQTGAEAQPHFPLKKNGFMTIGDVPSY